MADQIPVKANLTSGAATSLGQFAAGDTVPIAHGGHGQVTAAAGLAALGGKKEGTRFRARLSPASGFASGSTVTPNIPTEDWDIGGYYSGSPNIWTPPAGTYHYSANVDAAATGLTILAVYVFVNGSNVSTLADLRPGSGVSNLAGSGGIDLQLNGTDNVELRLFMQFSSGTATVGIRLSGHYIGG